MQSGINCVQLVGKMTATAKDAAVKRFNEDPDCKIFLTSLKSGGAALNLPVASYVSQVFLNVIYLILLNLLMNKGRNIVLLI